jgi:hypothetical protein
MTQHARVFGISFPATLQPKQGLFSRKYALQTMQFIPQGAINFSSNFNWFLVLFIYRLIRLHAEITHTVEKNSCGIAAPVREPGLPACKAAA